MTVSTMVPQAAPSVIRLPAGNVKSLDSGQVLSFAGRVVAVGISPTLFLVVKPPMQSEYPWALLEQLIGYLVGKDAAVLRVNIFFPEQLHHNGDVEKTAAIWVKRFLTKDCKRRLYLLRPPMPPSICLPWDGMSENALVVWIEVQQLGDAYSAAFPAAAAKLRSDLSSLVQMWESHWNEALEIADEHEILTEKDRPAIYAVDRAWATVVRNYLEPTGFRMSAKSLARLW